MKKHLFLFILTLAFLSVSNVWAGEQYIFPVTSASTVSGGTINTDANGNWYAELSNENDYVEIPFTVDNSREYLVKIGYTTEETGAELRLGFYRSDSYIAPFGNHGISTATSITEKDCGAQLNTTYIDGCKPYKLRIQPAPNKTMQVYYMKLVSNDATTQPTANITSGLNFVATTTTGDQIITNSDFLYSHKKEDRVKTQNKEGYDRTTFTNGYVTAASRKLYTFETGTYKFTLQVFTEESNTYNKPYVFVNNVVAGGGTYYFDKDDASAGGKYRDWEIEIDVTAGTYPIAFYFPSVNEKLFYRLASVEKKATSACPSAYSFHYGTNMQSDWTIACFENGAETDERVIENFTIPTVPDFYVGWQGNPLDNDMTVRQAWNTDVADLGNGVMNGAMVLLPVRGTSKVGWAQGAVGTLRCWYGSKSKNQYVGFQPNGYAIMYGGNNYAFEETGTANKLETDVVTLPAVSTTYQMGIATADSYVTCAHSNAAEAISNMGVTNVAGGKKAIYLVPGSFDGAGAKYAVWDGTNSAFDGFMTDADGDGIYVGYVGSNCSTINLVRLNSNTTDEEIANSTNNYKAAWDKKWNQTSNIGISGDLAKKYTITSLSGDNCSYTTANMQPITGQKGKFRMWDNSADQNWYVHFIPYYVLTYNANGGSGTTAATERNSESSTLTVSVASNGFTAPTGHEFAGWNTLAGGGGDSYAAGASYTLTANGTLYAQWSPSSYTVTLNTNDGTINAGDVTSYTYGTGATLPTDVTKTGYDFGGWYDNSELTGDRVYSIANNVTGNKEYWAKWTAKTTTITIDANTANHGSSTPGTVTATWGQALPAFTAASGASGWSLEGYYSGANDGTKIINADGTLVQNVTGYTSNDATPVWIYETSTLTLYPHYDPVYTVTVNVNNGSYGSAEANKASYFAGAMVTITAAANIGYLFDEWTTSDAVSFASSTSAITTFTMPSSNVTVQANFDVNPCTNIYTIDCGSTANFVTPTGGKPLPSDNEAGIYTDYYTGYHGSGYYDFKNSSNSEIYYKVHLPAAQYKFEVYTATDKYNQFLNVYKRTDGESGDINYGGYYYSKIIANSNEYNNSNKFGIGCTVSNQNLAEEDYIIGLSSDGAWAAYDQVVITANSNVFCQYTVSATATNGSVSGTGTYYQGEKVTLTATPSSGYEFDEWSTSDVTITGHESDNPLTFTMPGTNVSLTATFEASCTPHDITLTNDGHGSATASPTSACEDEDVVITATPSSGYEFSSWTITKTSDGSDITASVSLSDQTSSATFTMPAYGVTVTATFAEITCWSSRTYQVEDILIAAGSVSCNDLQADGANTLVVNSTTNTSSSHYSDYMNNESGPYGGGYVMNTAASRTIYMEVDIPLAGSYDIALWYGKNDGTDKVEWLNIYTRTGTSYTTLTYGGNTYYKLENDGYRVSSTASSSYYISTTPYEKTNLSLPEGKIVIGIWSEYANAVYDQIRITHHDDRDVFCKHDITVNTTTGASADATASVSKALSGTTVTVTAAAASAGYAFTGWTVTSGSATFADASDLSTTFVMPDADVTVQANYASSGYVVNYEVVGGNGTITSVKDGSGNDISSGDAVASGTVLTFTASPSSGYAVLGWYTYLNSTETLQGNTQNSNTFNYEVTGAITIRVKFDTPYTLTLNSSPAAASATVSGGGSYVQGTVVSVSTSNENGDYTFVHWMDGESEVSTSAASNYVMPASNKTLTAVWRLSRISSLSWAGSEDLGSGMEIASSCFDGGCFDTDVTFTFTGDGTVSYYDNTDRETSLGTVTSGTAITLTDALRAHGIYIRCTSGAATLTAVSKTTIGSVYQIWSAAGSTLGAVEVGYWSQQVVLGPEHFQTAIVGDVLRVNTSDEGGDAQGALQYILTEGGSHTYKGLDNYTDGGLHNWDLTSGEKSQHYFEITINATHLANLKRYGAIVKGRYYTIQSVELRASCSNRSMRTTAPDITRYADVNIMTTNIDFGEGFTLGNWEHKLELDESCFTSVTVGSVINLYMSVDGDATLSFRCNVDSVHAQSYGDPPLCPSYGDISFDRTIDDLYGDAPAVVGATEGYKVLYLLVDADMRRRLQETGMILCGKGTLIKVVEGVEETVTVTPGEEKKVPTVVNNLTIYQGGEVTNTEDIEVLGKITYIRPAKDNGTSGKLGNKLDQWYTFALPFAVSDVEVYDEADEKWYDINAVYYSSDETNQATNDPNGAGHYYLQYLKADNATAIGSAFAARWQYITPGHSLACVSEYEENDGTRYGYPKKDEAYIILFDSDQPIGDYFQTNTQIRFVGVGPQTIDGVAKEWKVEADGEQYWMYANNTLHSFTLTDAYILNDAGTEFVLQESPTIRPFECYVQATESLKDKYAAIPMRGFHIDNTPTGMEQIQTSPVGVQKILIDGQIIIIRNGDRYNATGLMIR